MGFQRFFKERGKQDLSEGDNLRMRDREKGGSLFSLSSLSQAAFSLR